MAAAKSKRTPARSPPTRVAQPATPPAPAPATPTTNGKKKKKKKGKGKGVDRTVHGPGTYDADEVEDEDEDIEKAIAKEMSGMKRPKKETRFGMSCAIGPFAEE